MTAQASEIFCMAGECHPMLCTPLDVFFDQVGWWPESGIASTALYRGYVARWEAIGGKLYLSGITCDAWSIPTHLAGKLEPDPDPFDGGPEGTKTLRLHDLFPNDGPLVPATWVTGVITIATSDQLVYVHAGFASLYRSYRLLNVVQGRIRRVRDLSARDWARRVGRHLPDDWFDEEPEMDDEDASRAGTDELDATESWWTEMIARSRQLANDDQDPMMKWSNYHSAQLRALERPSGERPTPHAPWPQWREQRRRARLWLTEGRR